MILKSKIKEMFSDELLKLIASVCDTRRIDSLQRKMLITQQLLKTYGIRFEVLGGATNRLSVYIAGVVFKIAMDRQGYKDNLMEYSLSKELQPYVTKTFETNGYISIAETVRVMTREEWKLRRMDILRVLDILGKSYLLGDVGYINKNFTNWGIRDDGSVVILDYAYVHRGTAKLFMCDVCGDGVLAYDATFSELRCTNVTGSCGVRYTYIERKMIEGDQVDYDMIDDVKTNQSIKLDKGVASKKVKVDDSTDGALIDGNTVIIRSPEEHERWETEVSKMNVNYDRPAMLSLMIKINRTKDPVERERLRAEYHKLYEEAQPEELRGVHVRIDYDQYSDETSVLEEDISVTTSNQDDQENQGEFNVSDGLTLTQLLQRVRDNMFPSNMYNSITSIDDTIGVTIDGDAEISLGDIDTVSYTNYSDLDYDDFSEGIVVPSTMDEVLEDDTAPNATGTTDNETVDDDRVDTFKKESSSCVINIGSSSNKTDFQKHWEEVHPVVLDEPESVPLTDDVNSDNGESDKEEIVEHVDTLSQGKNDDTNDALTEEEARLFADVLQKKFSNSSSNDDQCEITIDGKPLNEVL